MVSAEHVRASALWDRAYRGCVGVIALFGDAERATLPLKPYQLMGSYRMEQAAAAAVLLLSLSLSLFWLFDRMGRYGAQD